MKIAVVGSGISGLAVAWLLSRKHDVHLFEKRSRLGGHTHTVVHDLDGEVPVDSRKRHEIELVIDRVVIRSKSRGRIADSVIAISPPREVPTIAACSTPSAAMPATTSSASVRML